MSTGAAPAPAGAAELPESPAPAWPPWPPAYQGRVAVLQDQLDGLAALLRPLHEAHRAFSKLGGDLQPPVSRTWVLPAGATLVIRAGFSLATEVGEIGRGVVPPPDPVACLASALCNAERWRTAMAEFASATQWATEQAAEWHLTVPGFD